MSKPGVQRLAWLAIALGLGGCDKSPAALAQEAADRAEFESSIQASRELDQELDLLEGDEAFLALETLYRNERWSLLFPHDKD